MVPKDYCRIIANSKKSVTVKIVYSGDVLNFSKWWPPLYKKIILSDDSSGKNVPKNQKLSFTPSHFYEFTYSSKHPEKVVARPYIDDIMKNTFQLLHCGHHKICMSSTTRLAYSAGNVLINGKKLDKIRLIDKYVDFEDGEAQEFYEELLQWPTTEQEVE